MKKFKCPYCYKKEATIYDLRCNGWKNEKDEYLLYCNNCHARSETTSYDLRQSKSIAR